MITDFSNITSSIVKLALEASSLQHNLLATNIANANSDNFNASRIDFSKIYEEMSRAMEMTGNDGVDQTQELKNRMINGYFINTSEVEGVELDSELIGLSKNTIMYKTLLSALSSRGELMQLAINGEKR